MKQKSLLMLIALAFVICLSSCGSEALNQVTPAETYTIQGEILDRKTLLQITIKEVEDSLSSNLLPYGFKGQLQSTSDPRKKRWLLEDITLNRISNSKSIEDIGLGFFYNDWRPANGIYIRDFIVLLDDSQYTLNSLPYKTIDDFKKDKSVVVEYEGTWKDGKSAKVETAKWRP